jgi:Small-conductance mechanosensitive channel
MAQHITQATSQDLHNILPLIIANGLSMLGAIAILVVGLWLSGKANLIATRLLAKAPHLDQMLINFFAGIARYLILTITVLAILSQFGIQTTSLVAILGAAGLAIGLALQGTLANLAAGVMLLIFRPFAIGHSVQIGGIQGVVKDLSLFWTELVTSDNVQIIVPNNGVWGQPLRNFSIYAVRGFELHFRVPDTVTVDSALTTITSLLRADDRITSNPAPTVVLSNAAADNSFEIVVNAWASAQSLTAVKSDTIRRVLKAFAAPAAGR